MVKAESFLPCFLRFVKSLVKITALLCVKRQNFFLIGLFISISFEQSSTIFWIHTDSLDQWFSKGGHWTSNISISRELVRNTILIQIYWIRNSERRTQSFLTSPTGDCDAQVKFESMILGVQKSRNQSCLSFYKLPGRNYLVKPGSGRSSHS